MSEVIKQPCILITYNIFEGLKSHTFDMYTKTQKNNVITYNNYRYYCSNDLDYYVHDFKHYAVIIDLSKKFKAVQELKQKCIESLQKQINHDEQSIIENKSMIEKVKRVLI
jgi:glutathionylspermidine synthase